MTRPLILTLALSFASLAPLSAHAGKGDSKCQVSHSWFREKASIYVQRVAGSTVIIDKLNCRPLSPPQKFYGCWLAGFAYADHPVQGILIHEDGKVVFRSIDVTYQPTIRMVSHKISSFRGKMDCNE